MHKKINNHHPYPLRLGDIKPELQRIALEQNRSLGNLIITILKKFVDDRKEENAL